MPEKFEIPFTSGTSGPMLEMPEGACDSHHHIFDPERFPYPPDDKRNQPPATVESYVHLKRRLGISRSVVITPSAYKDDNRCTLDAVAKLGDNARAVVVLPSNAPTERFRELEGQRVCGVRFNITIDPSISNQAIKEAAQHAAERNWHLDFWMPPSRLVASVDFLSELPCRIVFDHRGNIPKETGVRDPAFVALQRLLDMGKTWVKISAPYHGGTYPDFPETLAIGAALIEHSPERVLWGTDWPHPSEYSKGLPSPDDAALVDLLESQAPGEDTRHRILVDNPAEIFGFER